MALNNIKNLRKESGFTIVELLIVIVVIAILATISIVAYSGIQTRAKASKSESNAASVIRVAEAYYSDTGFYPSTRANFTSNSLAKLPTNITLPIGATAQTVPVTPNPVNATYGEDYIMYRHTGTAGAATGGCVFYWDFDGIPPSTVAVLSAGTMLGAATTTTCTATGTTAGTGNSMLS